MNKMILRVFSFVLSIASCVSSFAQQTSLVVDCQTPGWLSSKISYGDQMTVESLKVIGYLNEQDLKFISNLASYYSLHKRLDLEDANIVGNTPDKNNYLINDEDIFGNGGGSQVVIDNLYFQFFSYPKNLTGGDARAMNRLSIDTLYINTTTEFTGALMAKVNHIKIGDNVTILKYPSFNDVSKRGSAWPIIESIEFPSTLKEIRETWNSSKSYNTINCNIEKGIKNKVYPSLERLVASFKNVGYMPDSIFFPKIKFLSLDRYNQYSGNMFKGGMHVFIGNDIETVTEMGQAYGINLHFSNPVPPVLEGSLPYHYQLKNDSYFRLYVPKGSSAAYRALFKDNGTNVTIIEENPSEVKSNVAITAQSYSRIYGEENPKFEYAVDGEILNGTIEITCAATLTSPIGTYPITITKGTVTNYNDTYVNGTLTINKAPLTITAKSYTIRKGDPLPMFEATYSGFKNNETSDILIKKPSYTCSAAVGSAPGTYSINVSGAEADNYDLLYTNGVLTVVERPMIPGDVNGDGKVDVADHVKLSEIIMNQDNIIGE